MTISRDRAGNDSAAISPEIARPFHAHPNAASSRFVDGLVELSRAISLRPGTDQVELMTTALIAACAAVPGRTCASLTLSGSSPNTPATSEPIAAMLDRLQYELGDGPCLSAIEQGSVVVSEFASERRWPQFVEKARQTPVAGSTSYPLSVAGHPNCSLNFYSESAGDQAHRQATDLAAASFAITLTAINEHVRAHHLEVALKSSRQIGAAIGILMSIHKVTDDQAFDLLRMTSQNTHRKLREVAEDVLLTGALPETRCP